MTVFLLVEQGQFPLLVRKEDNLVIHHRVHIGNMVYLAQQIDGHHGIVHRHVLIGTQHTGQSHRVHIQQRIDLTLSATHLDAFAVNLEVRHRHILVTEVDGEETVCILTGLLNSQKLDLLHTTLCQLVTHLMNLDQEVTPLARIIRQQRTLLRLLRNNQIGTGSGICPAIEETEIGIRQETAVRIVGRVFNAFRIESFPHKHILLMQRIALTERLHHSGHQCREVIVTISVSRILLHRVLHLQDSRILAGLGIEHPYPIGILNREIDVLEGIGPFTACAKGIDRHGHAH